MNRISREERSADEIDLRVVFEKIGHLIKKVFGYLRSAVLMVFRRWPLFLLLTLLGSGLGFMDFKNKRPYYRSSMTVLPAAAIRNEFFQDQVNRLAKLVQDANFEVVAADLKMSVDSASQIKGIGYFNIDPEKVPVDSVLQGAPFRVDVELYDNKFYQPVQKALIAYLDSNPYFSRSTQAKREQMRSMIEKLRVDIASIDSIKRTAVELRGPVNGFVYGEPLDPTELYRQSAELFEKQAYLEAQLQNLETVQVVVGFAPITHPTGPNEKLHLVVGAMLGFVAAFLLALWLEYRLLQKRKRFQNL
ncbi:chain length determinant protein [Rufibacter hautae]|uniref:Chain length determinant protein n=1 Tax=Rufibacter hautae TaxID=2595005 RepID=A0A5B6TH85_9BACT|nr:chain length determinant protein [Rufibacter hautae]KAA3438550.1 chain length determinant protein [Rufibacter hautae]